ncbi:MAG: hypothetical protein P1R58_10565, partial [bacterium]|nr:hypothetical protein [bacterium]
MRNTKIISVVLIGLLLLSATIVANDYSDKIESVLNKAGENSSELRRVLNHYAASDDTLKYQAARFLIGNMEDHSYVTYRFVDTSGAEVPFDISVFETYDSLLIAADSIERERGEMDYQRDTIIYDCEVITADFLIEQIDLAFQAWRTLPWSRSYSYEDFRRYILPYRGSNEPLEAWRQPLVDRFATVSEKMENSGDPIEAASLINDSVRSFFGFDPRYYY